MPFLLLLAIGFATCFFGMGFVAKLYNIQLWKSAAAAIALVLIGAVGAIIMSFIETGQWGGISFYGGAFLLPILMYPASKMIKVSYNDIMDMAGPGGSIMLIVSKIKCAIDGCCYGRMIYYGQAGFRFPSQIVESIFGAILLCILVVMLKKGNNRGIIYFWCLFLYGIGRFVLNMFRETTPWIFGLPSGAIWSILAVLVGGGVILAKKKKCVQ